MSLSKLVLLFTFAASPLFILGQKTELTHSDLATWNRISNRQISANGQYVAYRLTKEVGNPSLNVYNSKNQQTWTYPRAERPYFSNDSRYVAFLIAPDQDSIKMLKRQKAKKTDMPNDSLGILDLSTMQLTKIADVQSFKLPSKWSGWISYQLEPQMEKKVKKDSTDTKAKKKKVKKESKANGSKLVIHNLSDDHRDTMLYVTNYSIAEEEPGLAYTTTGNDSLLSNGVYVYDFEYRSSLTVLDTKGEFKNLTFDKQGKQLAFIGDIDTTDAQVRPYELYTYAHRGSTATVKNTTALRQNGWIISERANLRYSKDGERLFFGIAPQPILQDTSILKEEIVNVEVWNYKDGRLYTQQEVSKKRDTDKSYLCMMDTKTSRMMQIETSQLPQSVNTRNGQQENMIIYDERPYEQLLTWEGYTKSDAYLLNLSTGSKTLIGKGIQGRMRLSPMGNFATWYNRPDTAWYSYDISNRKTVQLTSNDVGPFYDELNDRPMPPYPQGMAGYNEKEDQVYIYDRYDIWSIDPSGKSSPKRLTKGREQNTRYRYTSLDREQQFINTKAPGLLSIFNFTDKTAGWATMNWKTGKIDVLEQGPNRYRSNTILKASDANVLVFTKEDYQTFPDLILADTQLKNQRIISNANPQKAKKKWGNMEMVSWTSLDGIKLNGLLLKPDNFDPSKKYPMIVNFYERNSDGLYNHRPPSVGRSTINYPFYASKDYIIFNPDIPYKNGYPGESAYNAVMPGVTKLIAEGYVDEDNIALQGHSWGGYQIAYMITRTNMFKCVESGAPVVNMFSAYGGIRWGSGMSRMFQYERTQSRIGGTIWETPLRYLENSPIFFMDKVNTPVLIMHNDEDGAVPWEQGIEFFGALRRLGKPAWMLTYNGEPHWPVKLQNRQDFNIRMQQFFDYYLKGAAIPSWMDKGVNPINKGINQGLELMKE